MKEGYYTNLRSTRISKVEKYFLEKSGKRLIYAPTEKIPVIQVGNFPELGKLTALRFIEWVQQNPEGVIALPTGKTPEYFIKWVSRIKAEWNTDSIKRMLEEAGLDVGKKPNFKNLKFVQIDEFYPIDSNQHNSFYYYIKKFYFRRLGLNPDNAMYIDVNNIGTAESLPLERIFHDKNVDLSLRTRCAGNRQERLQKETIEIVDAFCTEYEKKIRDLGGIGFFLGGIGPDGHIGFNVRGSDQYSTTRLIETNYETQAAAASDLGGIEIAKSRLVITIGLNTITFNKNAVAIITAAGEAKANIVRDSIQSHKSNLYPASTLQNLKNARFYLTDGAALRLMERRYIDIQNENPVSDISVERAIINLAVSKKKKLVDLSDADIKSDKLSSLILNKVKQPREKLLSQIEGKLVDRIKRGLRSIEDATILHTAPHHDDIMLGYLPYINHLVRTPNNKHHFAYLTSGFTAVTNAFMLELLHDLMDYMSLKSFSGGDWAVKFNFSSVDSRNLDVQMYLDSIAAHSLTKRKEALSRRLLRNMCEIYEEENLVYLKDRVEELINYFSTQYPGKKDIAHVQKLKGMQREFEVEILWGRYGFSVDDVSHLRLGFYQGDIFSEQPEINRDVEPVLNLIRKMEPNIVTVAFDPEGSGPDTHYKVMQAIAEALKLYQNETGKSGIKVWGYRNVWYRFHPAEANLYVPISLNSFAILEDTFIRSFASQKDASFPSWEYDGPFNRLAQKIQVEQYDTMNNCIGWNYFLANEHPRIRAAKGMIFMRELNLDEFYHYARELRKVTEL